jgi:hypothetical protein
MINCSGEVGGEDARPAGWSVEQQVKTLQVHPHACVLTQEQWGRRRSVTRAVVTLCSWGDPNG